MFFLFVAFLVLLKPVWEKYITAKLRYTSADLYLIPAAPLGWIDSSPELEQNWQLLKWEIETIRNMKPGIRLGIVLSAGWNGTGTPSDTDVFKFLEKMFAEGIDIDVIGMEYHPGLDGCSPDISDMEKYYYELTKFNRDIFIWEIFAIAMHRNFIPILAGTLKIGKPTFIVKH